MRIKLRSAMAAMLGVVTALAIALAGSPAAAELVAGASASQAAHAAKKKAAHKKAAHKKKAHKKKAHKKKKHKKATEEAEAQETEAPPAASLTELEKGGTKAIENASEIPLAPAFTKAELTAQPKGNWISSQGGGATGDHYSQLSEITPANVASLKSDWMTQLDGSGMARSTRARPT